MTYASISDVRTFSVATGDASDAVVTGALARATEAINLFTGQTFGDMRQSTVTIDGVANNKVPIGIPFSAVTNVTVTPEGASPDAAITLTADQYEVNSWGIRLFEIQLFDSDGFPLYTVGLRRYPRQAAVIRVTATFGSAITPQTISDACVRLAARYSLENPDTLTPSRSVSRLQTEGYMVMVKDGAGETYSTGDEDVDTMLIPFINTSMMVD